MRGYYLWNGGSPHDVDDIQYDDAVTMWKLMQTGMVGPLTNYIPAYNNYAMQHNASGSKKKPEKLQKVFESQMRVMALKDPTVKANKAEQAALQLGMPEHIRKRFMGG